MRWPSVADSKAEKERVAEEGGMCGVPDSRFRAVALSSACSGIGRAGLPTGLAASICALQREEVTEDEVDLARLE